MQKGKKVKLDYDAKYDRFEDGKHWFICLKCYNSAQYWPWEIPIHLKRFHKISRKRQLIMGWNEGFEKEYLENRNKPIIFEYPDPSIRVDETHPEEYERDRQRIKRERESIRDK